MREHFTYGDGKNAAEGHFYSKQRAIIAAADPIFIGLKSGTLCGVVVP